MLGFALSAAISLVLTRLLPGIKPADPFAYANVVLVLSLAVILASLAPARRATHVDPVSALRSE